ncbi:magnesium transporter [Haliangium ochraceum]|uniref:Magnesium transporter MgtE n=1 Tax=Haliangium ochraceum (strain DSM 14365 / JCM 11303 / SMP-2) TaxID=502025 RepID=D0LT57_HALO1|nr:magnesium transporter [Haliangium ochraceum]ACY19193.1 magnesium transporter [Haliangium ochraceum DSM 14365]
MHGPFAQLAAPDVQSMLQHEQWREVREAFTALEPADVAEILDAIEDDEDAAVAFRLLPRALAAEVFSYFTSDKQESLLDLLGAQRALQIIESMRPDDRVALLDELPVEIALPMVRRLSPEQRRVTQAILGYDENSVGRLMTPDYVRVKPSWNVARAIEHIRRYGRDAETVHWVFVVEEDSKLVDDIHIRTLLLADPARSIESLIDRDFIALHATDDREEAVRMMAKYDRTALPVIDSLGLLVGIVTVDDVADVAEEEATEDVHKLGGLEALDQPYMSTGFGEMLRKRGVWLAGLFVMQLFTIGVMSSFDEQLNRAVVLAVFVPLIISSGGNTGTQAASLLVRAIALGEVSMADWWRVASKELGTGLVLGSVLGGMGTVTVIGLDAVGFVPTPHVGLLAFTVGTAVVGIVIWGALIGSLLPILLQRVGLDPATSSSPLVATLMDISGLSIYFLVAISVLRGTLL